jgi:glycosyltransferase involved in cell wall biosynthesis
VVTILDLIWHHHPGAMSQRNTALVRMFTKVSAARAQRVIAISEAAKNDLVETFGIPADRIDVTLLGSNGAPLGAVTPGRVVRERFGIGRRRFVLCAAQKRVHKNLLSLVAAIPHLKDPDVVVVMPGTSTPYEDELRRASARLGVADRLLLPSWVAQEDLESLFKECSAFALPSLMEGFGLPILEAMERGVPVACSNVSSLPEVAGGAALLFDPRDPRDIASKIDRILEGGPDVDDMITRGYRRCQELTWDQTALATLASYRRAITLKS